MQVPERPLGGRAWVDRTAGGFRVNWMREEDSSSSCLGGFYIVLLGSAGIGLFILAVVCYFSREIDMNPLFPLSIALALGMGAFYSGKGFFRKREPAYIEFEPDRLAFYRGTAPRSVMSIVPYHISGSPAGGELLSRFRCNEVERTEMRDADCREENSGVRLMLQYKPEPETMHMDKPQSVRRQLAAGVEEEIGKGLKDWEKRWLAGVIKDWLADK